MSDFDSQLIRLYAAQAAHGSDGYLTAHSRNRAVIRRQVSIFERLKRHFDGAETVLDWGCRQGADACMVRMLRGKDVDLHGCDVDAPSYPAFFDFADLQYRQLHHPWSLPYHDDSFDVVIGSGVLEHVPNDSESLKELYRVLKPGGRFVMTMLPNRYSWTEWLNRRLGNPHHLRMYALGEARSMFMHHGFMPIDSGYHQVMPSLSSPKGGIFNVPAINAIVEKGFALNPVLERLWPLNLFATNIFVVGKKVEAFHG